ncbi:MAG: FkbM family methyltransferase [Terracidiphilus sp.]
MNVTARALLERLSRNRILKRHLPAEFRRVPILVSPEASLSFWKPRLNSDLFDFASEFVSPGKVVWDIGANIGLFSIAAAERAGSAGTVIAVEADIWLANLLRKSASLQPKSSAPIQVLPVAVADSLGIATFNIAKHGRAGNFLSVSGGSPEAGGIRESVITITVTLDWLLEQGIPAPQILKIDVESAETLILRGAQRILSDVKPFLLCEVFSSSRDAVTDTLLRYGYTLFDWDSKPRVQTTHATFNTLAIPTAR